MRKLRRVFARVYEDRLLLALIIALVPLLWLVPDQRNDFYQLIHWPTLTALAGLMLLSRGIEDSYFLNIWVQVWARKGYPQRTLVALLCIVAAALSAIITNDVALFILVPLGIGIAKAAHINPFRLVIFLAFAVNAGSSLSPIGNPQNLLLWQTANISFLSFTATMLPIGLVLIALVLLFIPIAFPASTAMQPDVSKSTIVIRKRLFFWSLSGYPLFIVALELGFGLPAFLAILIAYSYFNRAVVYGIDWLLLLVFALMFINLGLLAQLPIFTNLVNHLISLPGQEYLASIFLSQVISNVPATIFLLNHLGSGAWVNIAYGASVGGFGFVLGSMANLIALRLAALALKDKSQKTWRQFHYFSVPLLLLATILGALLLNFRT